LLYFFFVVAALGMAIAAGFDQSGAFGSFAMFFLPFHLCLPMDLASAFSIRPAAGDRPVAVSGPVAVIDAARTE
jgi:hypothetical protein